MNNAINRQWEIDFENSFYNQQFFPVDATKPKGKCKTLEEILANAEEEYTKSLQKLEKSKKKLSK